MNIANALKVTFVIALLGWFAVIGIGCLVNPDWGIKKFGSIHLRGGGDLRREWNRVSVQLVGAAMTAFVVYLVYHLVRD